MIVQLGKYGDAINILPYAFMLSRKMGKVDWLIGKPWASLLEGVSYVNPVIWPETDDTLARAVAQYRGRPLRITQAWRNPDTARETNSFAKEQWRYAGALPERGKWPLIFDKRDLNREQALIDRFIQRGRKNILVGITSVSTPYKHGARLLADLREKFPEANVICLDDVRAIRLYDLIGLYDAADILVSVDTCHLHLVRASQCPVVALVNDGWMGCVPPPQCIAAWRYQELHGDLSPVVAAVRNQLFRKIDSLAFICNSHDTSSDRHKRAMATHPEGMIYCKYDHRPTTKELFTRGLQQQRDAVVFTNDDVTFPVGAVEKIKAHLQKFDFGCSRRPRDPVHCGREIFWFRTEWLRDNWDALPDCYWSVQKPDLILCRWMRKMKGIPTTLENLNYDFPPVEMPDVILHEDHVSNWSNFEVEHSLEGLHNEGVWASME